MDLRQPLSILLLLTMTSLWISSVFAEGPLEPVALSGQCLQAGAVKHYDDMAKMPKWLSRWPTVRHGSLATLEDCDQHPQQDWADDNGQLTSMFGDLSVIFFKKHIIPVVQKGRSFIKTYPVTLQQGRLVFTDRHGHLRCLIPKKHSRFGQATLEECKNTPELSEKSRWLYAMPPDPGEAGDIGLAGVDSDQDGIRDDVQRLISVTFQDESEEIKEAVNDVAVVKQKELIHAYDKQKVLELLSERESTFNCFLHRTQDDRRKYYVFRKRLDAKLYNTYDRLKAKNTINSYFGGMIVEDPGDYSSYCSPNSDSERYTGEGL